MILIKKCIKIRLSEELFHQLNEMISRTSLSREKIFAMLDFWYRAKKKGLKKILSKSLNEIISII